MNRKSFTKAAPESLVSIQDGQWAFVPHSPPAALELDGELVFELDSASRAVSQLAGVGETLANPHLLIEPFLRREAVLSSRIEGTQASISDLYTFEAGTRRPSRDAREVANYVAAMQRGQELLKTLPICRRLVNELHSVLLAGVRGEDMRPGELRERLVWIGPEETPIEDARFVPAPAENVEDLIAEWDSFVNADVRMPPLIQCALMHYQFETIHPYLDGNGRLGRLLIPLFLIEREVLPTPLLYLSAYLEQNRAEYYARLLAVSTEADWRGWLTFFLKGVAEQAGDAVRRSRELRDLHESYRQQLQEERASGNTLLMVDFLFERPVVTHRSAAQRLGISTEGARLILQRLAEEELVEIRRYSWPMTYVAHEVIEILQ